ncbi:hypothetical protein A4A49_64451, partial [Nicotiana attenuata]
LCDLTTTTTEPPTSILAGGSAAGKGFNLQFHPGKSAGDLDCPESGTPGEGNGGRTEQGFGCLWTMPMADNGEQRQHATKHRPNDAQQSNVPSLPVNTVLPRPGNGGSSSGADLCDHRSPNSPNTIIFCSTREEYVSTTQQHQKGNQQGPISLEKEKPTKCGRNNLQSPSNRLSPIGLGQGDRVQCVD